MPGYGRRGYSPYSTCKAAIVNLVQALAEELRPEGICINAVSPARTKTPMREAAFGKEEDKGSLLDPDSVADAPKRIVLHQILSPVSQKSLFPQKFGLPPIKA